MPEDRSPWSRALDAGIVVRLTVPLAALDKISRGGSEGEEHADGRRDRGAPARIRLAATFFVMKTTLRAGGTFLIDECVSARRSSGSPCASKTSRSPSWENR